MHPPYSTRGTVYHFSMLICAAMLCVAFTACHGGDKFASPANHEVVRLFNGTDLDGFYTYLVDTKYDDPRRVFSVTDGAIRISGDGLGYLSTQQSYADYHLIVEFRWGERNHGERIGKARDAGLFLHSSGPDGNSFDGNGAWKAAIECQIMEGSVGDFILIRGKNPDTGDNLPLRLTTHAAPNLDPDGWPTHQPGGQPVTLQHRGRVNWFDKAPHWSDTFGFRGPRDIERPAGQWNTLECVCRGDKITIRLNGVVVNHAFNVHPAAGPILLQCEGSEWFVRRVEIRPLK